MQAPAEAGYVVDFPTIGFLVADWIEAHCIIPDRDDKGQPFVLYLWQVWCTVNHYRVKPTARVGENAAAFYYRRSQIVGPQKCGKGPWGAAILCVEGVGPAVFDGWAVAGEKYRCADNGCPCGWEYTYTAGEAKGRPAANPLLQLLATSEAQVRNVYRPFKAMGRAWPLSTLMVVGEEFTRLPDDGVVETVTSSAKSRLGNPLRFTMQDENGLYTESNGLLEVARTMRRGAAGMGGRSIQTTNAWDPAENSDAQRTANSRRPDIFRYHRIPPAHLNYLDKGDRRRIHEYVYWSCLHVNLDEIEAEAAELIETDPAEAERFYGNRLVQGLGAWMPAELWERAYAGAAVAS
jgi:hypothetical protein